MKRNNIKAITYLMLTILFISGCGSKPSSEYEYRTVGEDIVPSIYLEKAEYYPDKVVIYWNGTVSSLDSYSFSDDFEIKGNTLVLKTDTPESFTSFSMSWQDDDYLFRYLNSDQYACIYTVMDSEGGLHSSGSIDRYYTEEEKDKQKEQIRERQEQQEEVYRRLEGTWSTVDGEFFTIYKEDDYIVEYSLKEGQGREDISYFHDNLYGKENNIGINYIDGPFEASFGIILSEDGQSFVYDEKTFYKGGATLETSEEYDVDTVLGILGNGYEPPFYCELDSTDEEGNYLIHIYELVDNGDEAHTATIDWITVNPKTGACENFLGETFNLEEKQSEN